MPNAVRLPPPLGLTWQLPHLSPDSTARYGSAAATPGNDAIAASNSAAKKTCTGCFIVFPSLRHTERRCEVAAGDAVAFAVERIAGEVENRGRRGADERDAVAIQHG